jgi:hypothetical protein
MLVNTAEEVQLTSTCVRFVSAGCEALPALFLVALGQ